MTVHNLAIVGSRSINTIFALHEISSVITFSDGVQLMEVDKVISGGAKGVDNAAELWAKMHDVECEVIPADKYGHPKQRNTEIVDKCDGLIAIWDGESGGTKDSIDKAKKQDKLVSVLDVSEGEITEVDY